MMMAEKSGQAEREPTQCRRIQTGYNHNFRHQGRLFHVQTEDSGPAHAHIYTHIFFAGTVIASHKTEYGEAKQCSKQRVRRLMRQSHRNMCITLRNGDHDARIAAMAGSAAGRRQQETSPHSLPPMADAANRQPTSALAPRSIAASPKLRIADEPAVPPKAALACLERIESGIEGFRGAAVIDRHRGISMRTIGAGSDFAATAGAEVLQRKMELLETLSLGDSLEDVLITLEQWYCVIRPLDHECFVYVMVDRSVGNLAMASRVVAAAATEYAG